MFCQDDGARTYAPLDSVDTSLDRLEGHLGLVAGKGHRVTDPLDNLLL